MTGEGDQTDARETHSMLPKNTGLRIGSMDPEMADEPEVQTHQGEQTERQ